MSDIVERLRHQPLVLYGREQVIADISLLSEAADEIEFLNKVIEVERKEHKEALEAERKKHEWVSVEERMPEKPYGCLLIVWDCNPMSGDDFLNHLPYFAGWDGEQWNDEDGIEVPFEVAYWMPLPDPPKGAEE